MEYPEDHLHDHEHRLSSERGSLVRRTWITLLSPRRLPGARRLEHTLRSFSPAERGLLYLFTILLATSVIMMLAYINRETTVPIPERGGSLTEGVVGTARFINPLLATSDVDQSLSLLVYSGLTRATPDGNYAPDLAEAYEISDDGTTYTFTLRPDLTFHDGTPLTTEDVAFTIELAQRPDIKSPKRADWEGVVVTVIDERTIQFTLERPYAPFLENTTLGILPAHRWRMVMPDDFPFHQLNTHPIGSGPFLVSDVQTDQSGTIQQYNLASFSDFSLGRPYLSTIAIRLYPNTESLLRAFGQGQIESIAGVGAEVLTSMSLEESQILRSTLPRVFAVFFNQNRAPVFTDASVRRALDTALDKQQIIEDVLGGYGSVLDNPIPPGILSDASSTPPNATTTEATEPRITRAQEILMDGGWELNEETGIWQEGETPLSFSLTTADTPQLAATAQAVATTWRELGADVIVQTYAANDLSIGVIRPREYEALLFGEVVGRTLDLFAFWHSSQRNDPGLNLALYANTTADRLLTQARSETDRAARENTYREFVDVIQEDTPAAFLYAPEFVYIIPEQLQGVELGSLTTPAERFITVHEWHTETERVWDIFANN